jgi:hypothetical protein
LDNAKNDRPNAESKVYGHEGMEMPMPSWRRMGKKKRLLLPPSGYITKGAQIGNGGYYFIFAVLKNITNNLELYKNGTTKLYLGFPDLNSS